MKFGNIPLATMLLVASFAFIASAQIREDFETTENSWRFLRSDCQARVIRHERTFREAHSGQASEHFELVCGAGTFAYFAFDVGQVPVIRELRPSLWLKSNRTGLQLLARVVLPRTRHPATGKPLVVMLRGASYRQAGLWHRLDIGNVKVKLERQIRTLRAKYRQPIDPRQAFVDALVINAFGGRGAVSLWLDDLEIQQAVALPNRVQVRTSAARNKAGRPSSSADSSDNKASPRIKDTLFHVDGFPRFIRAVDHNGESFQLLRALGFNTIKLSISPTVEQLAEAKRLGLWLVAPPPPTSAKWNKQQLSPVIAWSLGRRLTRLELNATRALVNEIAANGDRRPRFCSVEESIWSYSRLANVIAFERSSLLSGHRLSSYGEWLQSKLRLAQLGQVTWATVDTQAPTALAQQWTAYLPSRNWQADPTVDQIRLHCLEAIAAGARGLWFRSAGRFDVVSDAAERRKNAVRLVLQELSVIEPWVAGGTVGTPVRGDDPLTRISVLKTDRSKLILVRRHQYGQEHLMGSVPNKPWHLLLPGNTSPSANVFVLRPGVHTRLRPRRTAGGTRLTLPPAHHAMIVVSHDPLTFHHMSRLLSAQRSDSARLHYESTLAELRDVQQVSAELRLLNSSLNPPTQMFTVAAANLARAQQVLDANDFGQADDLILKTRNSLDRIRRSQWNLATRRQSSPTTSPFTFCYATLPLHFELVNRLDRLSFSGNSLAAGGMENLQHMVRSGWQRLDRSMPGTISRVTLDGQLSHSGQMSLYLGAQRKKGSGEKVALERPLVVMRSAKVRVSAGAVVKMSGWVRVDNRITGHSDGLHVYDSIGGSSLGQTFHRTRGWQRFEFLRIAPRNTSVHLQFHLFGFGSALIDEVSISTARP